MDPQSKTIAFTLPISCHICLGKVKQPVTCPNQHAFCKLCLQVWLGRTPACPTCRTPINEDTPFKPILGGSDVESSTEQRWDLLRARIEISLREYEQELDSQKNRNRTLENENKNLLETLASQVERKDIDRSAVGDFTVFNEELVEMKTSYEKAKREISELKRANRASTDQNVNLLRESELLRLEVSKRSPQKFSRITVATLQRKLEDSEKKAKQLQKALEKSDEYVSELHSQMKNCKCGTSRKENVVKTERTIHPESNEEVRTSKMTCQRNLIASLTEDRSENNSDSLQKNFEINHASRRSDQKPGYSSQMAALRVASSKIQDGRTQEAKAAFSFSTTNKEMSPYKFASPSRANLNIRGEMTSYRGTSPTKRLRVDDDIGS